MTARDPIQTRTESGARLVARLWLPVFLALYGLFVALPFAAPAAARSGHERASALIYFAYRVTCHQLPHHSWFLGGDAPTHDKAEITAYYGVPAATSDLELMHRPITDPTLGYQVAFCQRDTAIHVALLATAVLFALAGSRRPKPLRWRWYIAALIPIALDGGTGLIGMRESTPLLRTITGGLFGVATALLVLPYLDQGFRELAEVPVASPPPRPYRLLLGTHNPAKAADLRACLEALAERHAVALILVTPQEIGLADAVAETGDTFENISQAKARAYYDASGIPVVSDDGGLEIAALGGAPGVKSRRWLGGAASDEELIAYALERMAEYDGDERAARLRTCLTFFDGTSIDQECAAVDGSIARTPSSRRVAGYPYRSLFVVSELDRYYDDLSDAEHDSYNHRRLAAARLFERSILPAITRTPAPPGP